MTEATYNHFAAHLGDTTAEVEARLRLWASGCEEYSWARDASKRATLYFARAERRTTRQMQSLLRTLTARWRLPLGKLEAGWLQPFLLTSIAPLCPRRLLRKVHASSPKPQYPQWRHRLAPARVLLLGRASS